MYSIQRHLQPSLNAIILLQHSVFCLFFTLFDPRGQERRKHRVQEYKTTKLTFQEVILPPISFRLQGRECARGVAPHFTATLVFLHLRVIHAGVSLQSLSRFIVALTDKRRVGSVLEV